MDASPPFEMDDDSIDSDSGPPDPVDNEISPPEPSPKREEEPVCSDIEPLEAPPLGVLIVTSPAAEASLVPDEIWTDPP